MGWAIKIPGLFVREPICDRNVMADAHFPKLLTDSQLHTGLSSPKTGMKRRILRQCYVGHWECGKKYEMWRMRRVMQETCTAWRFVVYLAQHHLHTALRHLLNGIVIQWRAKSFQRRCLVLYGSASVICQGQQTVFSVRMRVTDG